MKEHKMNISDCIYAEQYNEGFNADLISLCPYGYSDIGARCAWLGGYFDKWGNL